MNISRRWQLRLKFLLIATAVPAVIYGWPGGPQPFVTGDPQDDKGATCNQSHCHVGTAVNGGGGKVQINLAGSSVYTPGKQQQISVTISDPAQKAWGFEFTARTLKDNSQTGDLQSADSTTWVQCADGGSKQKDTPCAASLNTQFVQQTAPKFGSGSATFTFQWTPPATDAGTIVFYAAGNAANGDGSQSGDHIYTTSVQLTAASSASPSISPGGVVPIFSTSTTIESGSWISIYGTNLAAGTATWNGDFPTSLGGVNVTVDGKPAYIWFVSPTQINVQVPDDSNKGTVNVVVTNGSGSATSTATLDQFGPTFSLLDATHPAGVMPAPNSAYDLLGPSGSFAFPTRPAKKGETVELFGTGFGPTDPVVPAGKIFTGTAKTVGDVTVSIDGVSQTVPAYIVGAGLYQVNVVIPANVRSGDVPLAATAGKLSTPSTTVITIQ